MRSYECDTCHGICDPGELVGNTCIECREKERLEIMSKERAIKLPASPFDQLEFGFGVKKDVI